MQRAAPPPLLPLLLRSRLQAEVLTLAMLNPGREWSLTDLATRVGASSGSRPLVIARPSAAPGPA
jgi:hypothetical protein